MVKHLLYTRQTSCPSETQEAFFDKGVEIISIPLIQTEAVEADYPKQAFDWLFFTSANAVHFFDFSTISRTVKIAAIGDKTASAVLERGWHVTFRPEAFYSEAFICEWLEHFPEPEQQILLPTSCQARHIIKEQLEKVGDFVYELPLYQTIFHKKSQLALRKLLKSGDSLDYAVFASPTAWRHFFQEFNLYGQEKRTITLGAIGPVTTKAIQQDGFQVTFEPTCNTMSELFTLLLKEIS